MGYRAYYEKVGPTRADIIPVLEGFGCNAAAVSQAASQCHQCTKAQCMSLISFGSSCSYQIGATLSIFNVAQRSWLFVPYLILVFLGGMLHNQLWRNRQQQRLITNSNFYHNFKFHWPQFFLYVMLYGVMCVCFATSITYFYRHLCYC